MVASAYPAITGTGFGLGWRPDLEDKTEEEWEDASGLSIYGPSYFESGYRTPKPAYTLAGSVNHFHSQGPVGSSFACAVVNALQIASASRGVLSGSYSRRWTWYHTRRMDGTLRQVQEGGSILRAIQSVSLYGAEREGVYGYLCDRSYLDRPIRERRGFYRPKLAGLVRKLSFGRPWEIASALETGNPLVVGMGWPEEWSNRESIDNEGRTTGVSGQNGYHSVVVVGKVDPGVWDTHRYYHILNTHGPIYPSIPGSLASPVVGLHDEIKSPAKRYLFWAREDHLYEATARRNSLIVCPVWDFSPRRIDSVPDNSE